MTRILLTFTALLASTSCTRFASGAAAKTPEQIYANAIEDLRNRYYPEAIESFSTVKSKYPYSQYAALAELGIADANFERESFVDAVDGYRNFLKYHPGHTKAAYATYKIAATYKAQLPDDYWFMPPSAEKDQASTKLAVSAYQDMLARFPAATEAKRAREELDECRRALARHELYVAEFYYSREKWRAAAGRAEGLYRDYEGLDLGPRALIIAADSRLKLGEWDKALQAAARIQNQFPETNEAERARSILRDLEARAAPKTSIERITPRDEE